MKKTKKAVSLILAFAMVLSAMLGCMTVSSFATEGQATEGPKLVDYSIDIANDTKTEAGAEFKIRPTDKDCREMDFICIQYYSERRKQFR